MPSPEQLGTVLDAAKIGALLPYLAAEIASLREQVEAKAAQLYEKGELTGEKAAMLWGEGLAYRRILRRFEQKVRYGASVGAEIGPEMALPNL